MSARTTLVSTNVFTKMNNNEDNKYRKFETHLNQKLFEFLYMRKLKKYGR